MSCHRRIRVHTSVSQSPARAAWIRHAALALLALWTSSALTAAGTTQEYDFDIPEGPLATTLLRIAQVTGTIVSFRPDLAQPHTAPAVRGRLTLQQALAISVAPSGLVVAVTESGTATVSAPPPDAAPAAAAATRSASPVVVPPAAAVLPRVEILGTRQVDGLRALRSWSATRSDTPLGDLSQAVSVLTPEALSLQGGSSMLDMAPFVPGASTALVATGGVENFGLTGITVPTITVRGLAAPYALSGLRSVTAALPPDNVFVERVEVPKGPSGVLDAIADFKGRGGMVNLLLKEPLPYEHAAVSAAVGSQDGGTVRLATDLGNTLSPDAAWRMVGYASRSGRTAGGFDHNAGGGLLGTLRWRRDRFDGTLTVQAERQRFSPLPDARGGRSLVDGVPVDAPPERVPSPPGDPADRLLASTGFVRTNSRWTLTPQWSLSLATLVEATQTDSLRHQPFTPPDTRFGEGLNVLGQLGLTGEIRQDNIKHRLLLGLDAGGWRTLTDGVDLLDNQGLLNVDIHERKLALVLQDEVTTGPLRLRASVQHARTPQREEIRRRIGSGELQSRRSYLPVSANNWDAGMLVQIAPGLAAYAGTQKTTEANLVLPGDEFAQDSPDIPDGVPLPPTTTRQVQAGLRIVPGPRLTFTGEAFRLRQDNLKLLNTFSLVIPGRASEGVELELTGRLRPNLDLSLGFTYLRCTETPEGGTGMVFECAQVPRRSMHLLSRIRLGERFAPFTHAGLAFHAAASTRVGQPYFVPTALTLPGGGRLDLQIGGDIGPWSVTASLRNVFDQRLFGAAADTRYLPLQPGRTFGLSVLYTP
jgi:iron complex outermembrane receptor protein